MLITKNGVFIDGIISYNPVFPVSDFKDDTGLTINIKTEIIIILYEGLKHRYKENFDNKINELFEKK